MSDAKVKVTDDLDALAKTVAERVQAIRPQLAGLHHAIQGAVLADLTAMWLAGHFRAGPAALEALFDMHIGKVHELIPPNVQILKQRGG